MVTQYQELKEILKELKRLKPNDDLFIGSDSYGNDSIYFRLDNVSHKLNITKKW